MATTITPTILKARAPAFAAVPDTSTTEPNVQASIDEAVRWMNEAHWGPSHYDDGVFLLACHFLTEDLKLASAPLDGQEGALAAGPSTSESIGQWSAAYRAPGIYDDAFAATSWGRRFIGRRALIFSPRVTVDV